MRNIKVFLVLFSPLFVACLFVVPATALIDISTHSFSNCGFPDTGQKICYNASTTPLTSCNMAFSQDATYMPSSTQPKYTVYKLADAALVTVDDRTGLMWITNAGSEYDLYLWDSAIYYCESLTYAGYADWRVPNVRELMSIVNYQNLHPAINSTAFPDTFSDIYWTSTTQ